MFLYLVNAAVRCLLHIVANIFSCSFNSFVIRVGRCARLRWSMRMSASVDADDVCILKKVA